MNPTHALGAALRGVQVREVQERQRDGEPTRVVVATRAYATNPHDLWDALTSAERLPRWFLPITGELELGGRYQLEGNAGGTITHCDPPKTLEITWEYGGSMSWVRLTLESVTQAPEASAPDRATTRLTLEHQMLKDEAGEAHWHQYGPGATGVGWDLALLGLGQHLEAPEATDPEQSAAWAASEEGKAFSRQSATAWGEAHIAAGEDPAIARAMATQTANAYTGD